MEYSFLDCEILDGVARVGLLGADTPPMSEFCEELVDALLRLQEDAAARAILLTDAGGNLDMGPDMIGLEQCHQRGEGLETLAPALEDVRRVITLIREMGKPVAAAVGGDVRDSGFGLIVAADVRLACVTASFTPPDMAGGLIPDWGLFHSLPRMIGPGRTLDLLWSGRTIGAAEAARIGLVDRLVPAESWDEEVDRFAARLASLPQPAQRLSKLAVQQSTEFDMTSTLSLEFEAQAQCWDSRETGEGLSALTDRRAPEYRPPQPDAED